MGKKICVIGAGYWGRNHIRTLNELGSLGGIVESDTTTLKEIQVKYDNVSVYNNLSDSLNDDYDGYIVATPAETHYLIARNLIESKKHLLVEKPLTLDLSDAEHLVLLARANKVNLMVGHLMLFHPAIRKIKEFLKSGKIGRLQYIYSNRLNLGKVRTKEDIIWSFAPHDISIFGYLTEELPIEIISSGGTYLQPNTPDTTIMLLKYPEGVCGHIFVSWLHPYKEQKMILIGSNGMLSLSISDDLSKLKYYDKGIDFIRGEPIKRDGAVESIRFNDSKPLTNEIKYFIDHLDGSPIETANGESAIEVLKVLKRAADSLSRNKSISGICRKNISIHSTSVIDNLSNIGKGTKIWHFSHIQKNVTIGENCSIGQNVYIGERVVIGDNVKIQNNVSVYEGVELENNVFCGPSMVFTNVLFPRSKYPKINRENYLQTLVKEGATLGANSTIICGTEIGKHSFVAAGAVVTKDVPDYAMMVGVPAKQSGWICECGQKIDEENNRFSCYKCGRQFEYLNGNNNRIIEAKINYVE